MNTLTQPLSRARFFVGVSLLNVVILIAVVTAFTFRPAGGGHLAVLVVVGALQTMWFVLHSRRFADAGRGYGWPLVMFLICFCSFAFGYLIMAALWSSPDIQREAFRTAGGLAGGGMVDHTETSALIINSGQVIASVFGIAGSVILSGLVIVGMGITSLVSVGFSIVAMTLSGGAMRTSGFSKQLNAA
jgi:hypothetical protein